jgi:hypothetical protein
VGTVAIVLAWIPVVLGLDRGSTPGEQDLLGLGTWLLLLGLLRTADPLTRAQVAVVVVFAAAIEYTFSGLLHVYVYRLHDVPLFVPPGHGLVYLAALSFGRDPRVQRHSRALITATLAAAGAYALWGVALSGRTDVLGALWFGCLVAFLLRGRQPLVYVGAFVVVTWLELLGTHLGIWEWARYSPTGIIPMGNPPSVAAGGYGFFDAAALAVGPWLVCQAQAVRTMASTSVKTGRQPSSAVIRAGSATSSAGSPARRPISRRASSRPPTASTVSSTSRTENPVPTPTL